MVFLGGAGVSTESGIPDFRSADGLYSLDGPIPPEQIISRSFFDARPADFYEFYCQHMLVTDVQPNTAHLKLAELERRGVLRCVITQNIDGLHTAAGSREVYELHGSVLRNTCMGCGAKFGAEELRAAWLGAADGVPRCNCGGIIKPDVVLYEEGLDGELLRKSVEAVRQAEMLVVAGTSLAVYPAAGLLDYFQGKRLVICNLSPTPRDRQADLCIQAKVGQVFGML